MSTHWKKLTNPNYLGSYSLQPNEILTVKIIKVQKELVQSAGGEKEECIVATLDGQKPMILNKTNCKTIEKLFGTPYIEEWKNKSIQVYSEKVKAFGDVVEALRVKKQKVDTREVLTPESDRWAGAIEALTEGKCDLNFIKKNFRIDSNNLKKLQEASNA